MASSSLPQEPLSVPGLTRCLSPPLASFSTCMDTCIGSLLNLRPPFVTIDPSSWLPRRILKFQVGVFEASANQQEYEHNMQNNKINCRNVKSYDSCAHAIQNLNSKDLYLYTIKKFMFLLTFVKYIFYYFEFSRYV